MNVLASTTRQWNCGDEFILMGCRNVCEKVWGRCNWAIFNRNPTVKFEINSLDNSWRSGSLDRFDHIIVAGSPEWFGRPLMPLFKRCKDQQREVIFLGIGYPEPRISLLELDKHLLTSSPLVVCRDGNAVQGLRSHGIEAKISVCPAFFSSHMSSVRTGRRVALVLQGDRVVNQCISSDLLRRIKWTGDVICHYIDEFVCLPHCRIFYSYDSRDYLDIYNDYDIIVSTRLHGAILAMSLGIPAILVADGGQHEKRLLAAAKQFPMLRTIKPEEIHEALDNIEIENMSKLIIEYKDEKFAEYVARVSTQWSQRRYHL